MVLKTGSVLCERPSPSRQWLAALGVSILLGTALLTAPASAQTGTTVERSARGLPAKNIQVGVYLNVLADCTSGTLPAIRLLAPPANGTLKHQARQGQRSTNYKQCLALEVPGFIAILQFKGRFHWHR